MRRNRRLKIGVFGVILIFIAYFLISNYQVPVELDEVKEVARTTNTLRNIAAGNYSWNVTASFFKGDIICGLVQEPQPSSENISWLNFLEPPGTYEPYGYINYPHIFVFLELYNGDELISKVEMVWVNDPNAKPPINAHLFLYNMSYLYDHEYKFPVDTVANTWIVLTPEGASADGNYTLKVFAFGAISPPNDIPPTNIALGRRLIGCPYTYFLPLGVCSAICGVFCIFISVFPKIIEREKRKLAERKR
jgi:hypothetical protein